jgi:hypothetical protein
MWTWEIGNAYTLFGEETSWITWTWKRENKWEANIKVNVGESVRMEGEIHWEILWQILLEVKEGDAINTDVK